MLTRYKTTKKKNGKSVVYIKLKAWCGNKCTIKIKKILTSYNFVLALGVVYVASIHLPTKVFVLLQLERVSFLFFNNDYIIPQSVVLCCSMLVLWYYLKRMSVEVCFWFIFKVNSGKYGHNCKYKYYYYKIAN